MPKVPETTPSERVMPRDFPFVTGPCPYRTGGNLHPPVVDAKRLPTFEQPMPRDHLTLCRNAVVQPHAAN